MWKCSGTADTDMNTTNLSSNRHIFIDVANDNGVKYNVDYSKFITEPGATNGTYYLKCDGGGLNQLHITTNTSNTNGQVTVINSTSTNSSGVFYITTTGGRGYNDELILLLSVAGPISDNFSVHITSSGYTWTITGTKPTLTSIIIATGALNETFTKSDFQYGQRIINLDPWSPIGTWNLPLYYGQNTSDPSTAIVFDVH